MIRLLLVQIIFCFSFSVFGQITQQSPAKQVTHVDTLCGKLVLDPYHWMNNKQSNEVLSFININNKAVSDVLNKVNQLDKELSKEREPFYVTTYPNMDIRTIPKGDYIYYEKGKLFSLLHCRKKQDEPNAKEEIIIDERKITKGLKSHYLLGYDISPNQQMVACSVGDEEAGLYRVRLQVIENSKILDELLNATKVTWINNQTILYCSYNKDSEKNNKVYQHVLGNPQHLDKLMYEDYSNECFIDIETSASKQYLFVTLFNNFYTETWYLDIEKSDQLICFEKRKFGHRYFVNHYYGDSVFYVLTNLESPNNKYVKTSINQTASNYWEDVLLENESMLLFVKNTDKYIVVVENRDWSTDISIINKDTGEKNKIIFEEVAHQCQIMFIDEKNKSIRLKYSSHLTPDIYYDYNIESKSLSKIFETQTGKYNKDDYVVELHQVPTKDSVKIPMIMIYNRNTIRDIHTPIQLTVYGAYGHQLPPTYNPDVFPLLDRGFCYVQGDVRGGGGVGSQWHMEGTVLKKKNSAYDVISIAQYLISQKYTSQGKIFASAVSDGGLALGMAVNMFPDLFGGVYFHVGKFDVLFDKDQHEWLEHGNPNIEEQCNYMLTYSPYQNIKNQSYPAMLFHTGYLDTNVPCYETLKMAARLQANQTNSNPILLNTDMEGNHAIRSGKTKMMGTRLFFLSLFYKLL